MWKYDINDWDLQPRRALLDKDVQSSVASKVAFLALNNNRGMDTPIWKIRSNGTFHISTIKEAVY